MGATHQRAHFHCLCGGLVAAMLLVAVASPVFAQTPQAFEEYGVSPRDASMGNSFTAVADDYAAAFYNPAGLSQSAGTHFTLGFRYLAPRVTAKFPGYAADKFTKYPDTKYGLFGFASDLNVPSIINPKITERFTMGTAIGLSNFVHSYTNYADPYTPYFYRYQDRPVALLSLYVAMAVRVTNWFSLGAGFVTAPSITYATARVRTDVYLPEGNFDAKQGTVNRSYSVVKPVAGALFRIPIAGLDDRLRVGAVWRDEVIVIDGKGAALNRIIVHPPGGASTIEPLPSQSVPVDTLSGFSPMQAALGLAYRYTQNGTVTADTIWKRWSRFQMYFLFDPDPKFHDTFQERVGVEQRFPSDAPWLESWVLRAGWYYEPSPAPEQSGLWNILDNDKNVFSAGGGLRLDKVLGIVKTPINLDAGFQVHSLIPQTIANDRDPGFPEIRTGGFVYVGAGSIEIAW